MADNNFSHEQLEAEERHRCEGSAMCRVRGGAQEPRFIESPTPKIE